MIRVCYFAGLKDIAGVAEEHINDRSQLTVQQLVEWAEEKYADFRQKTIFVAVNEEYANPEDIIRDGDTVAFIPPVSGG